MTGSSKGGQGTLRALVFHTLLAAAFLGPALAGGRVFAFRDLVDFTIPQKLYVASELRELRLPLWNPLSYAGYPLLANLQSAALYPPTLLVAALPFPLGFNLFLAAHWVLAALGAGALAREAGAGEAASLLAGVAYGFSPYLLSHADLVPPLATAAWLPWVVRAGIRLGGAATSGSAGQAGRWADATGGGKTARGVAAAAVLLALAFLAAEPQTTVLAGALGLAAAVAQPVAVRARLRAAAAWAASCLVALLLVAPALLPFLELVSVSHRSGAGLPREEVFRDSLTLASAPGLALPGFGGDPALGTLWTGQSYIRSPYLGVLALALAAAGLAAGAPGAARNAPGRGRPWAWGITALAGLLLALGPSGGLYPLLYAVGFRQSRYPMKFLVLTALAIALLAARGLDRVAGGDRRAARALVIALLVLALGGGLAIVHGPAAAAVRSGEHALAAVFVAASILAGLALVSTGLGRERLLGLGAAAAVALAACDLLVAAAPLRITAPAALLLRPPEPALPTVLQARADGCAFPRVQVPEFTAELLASLYRDRVADELSLARRTALLVGNTNLPHGIATTGGGDSVEVRWSSDLSSLLASGPKARRLLDLVGAAYFLAPYDLSAAGLRPIATANGLVLHANPSVLPHAFLVGRATAATAASERLARMMDRSFDPAREAVVERELAGLDPACAAGVVRVTACGQGGRLEIAAESPGRCLLVVTDTWYPGWEATVDGRSEVIERVDHAFRGIVLGPGAHRIEFHYRPTSLRLGLALAAIGMALLVLLVRSPRAGRADSAPPPPAGEGAWLR